MIVKSVVFGPNNNIAVMSKFLIMITDEKLEKIVTIKEKFPVRSVFWESEEILFYTTHNHWKFAFMNGETGVLKTI